MSRKVFTPDEILTAEDVNSFLMDQTVMSFAGTAARGSAILAPVEGMVTYLEDTDALSIYTNGQWVTNRPIMSFATTAARSSAISSPAEGMASFLEDVDQMEIYSNSSWRVPYGMTPIVTQAFTNTTSVIISNCFSAKFDNYFIQVSSNGVAGNARFQLRTGTTTLATGYGGTVVYAISTSALATTRSSSFFESFGDYISAYLYRPFLAQNTGWHAISISGGSAPGLDAGQNTNASSYESLVLSYASNSTGTIRIYGLRN